MEQKNLRNFVIIAHIDHGKSTLADRFLELTGTINPNKMKPQFLDKMELERERGITIKLKPVRMELDSSKLEIGNCFPTGDPLKGEKLEIPDSKFILNLVDTPGHVDFSYEVSRALAAVEGAILLVDASKGIQAQTLANLELAKQQGLAIIPAVNKIDLSQAETDKTVEELANLLEVAKDRVLKISAKTGINIERLLEKIIKDVPPPKETNKNNFRALIFDSEYDVYRGVIAYVRVVEGEIKNGEHIKLIASKTRTEAKEIGYFKPGFLKQDKIFAGEIGYIATGIKEPGLVKVGDTIAQDNPNLEVDALPGYRTAEPMVFASLYPENADDYALLKDALSKLKLSDPSFIFEQETKEALGRGFRCGFLGTLHAEIVSERLRREFNLELVISTPSVVYKIADLKDKERFIYSASDWPDDSQIKKSEEPWVLLEIIVPMEYMGGISEVLKNIRGNYLETRFLSQDKTILVYEVPLAEVIINLYDKIKGISKGYGSMNYKLTGYREAKLVKMEILIAGEVEEAFSKIVPEEKVYQEGKSIVEKLKEVLPPEQFSLALQAAVGGKIIARETIKARRKDVTGYLYGGDYTRKRKLLEKQKKGKKLLKTKGRVRVPAKVFFEVFKK